jgi:AraC-like DNA-binding protein
MSENTLSYYQMDSSKHIGNFIFLESFEQICRCFYSLFGIRIAFFTFGGDEINPDQALPMCDYCRLVRNGLGLEGKCKASDRSHCIEAARSGKPVDYVCHSGLSEYIVPLKYGDSVFGNMMIGQYRTMWNIPAGIAKAAADAGIGDELERSFKAVRLVEKEELENIKKLLGMLTELIILRRMVTSMKNHSLERIILFMQQNPAADISLTQASEIAGCSVSAFSAMFREDTSMSFKQYQLKLKLDAAEQILRTEPNTTIKTAAERVGFNDPYHFSKIFKKHKGLCPSDCRAKA